MSSANHALLFTIFLRTFCKLFTCLITWISILVLLACLLPLGVVNYDELFLTEVGGRFRLFGLNSSFVCRHAVAGWFGNKSPEPI